MAQRVQWTDDRLDAKMSSVSMMLERIDTSLVALRSELKSELSATRDELRGELSATRDELRGELSATRDELRGELSATRTELRSEMALQRAELTAAIEGVRTSVDQLRDKMMLAGFSLSTGLIAAAVAIFIKV